MKLRKNPPTLSTDDFHYSLFQGYLRPGDYLEDPEEVLNAMRVIDEFESLLEDNNLVDKY